MTAVTGLSVAAVIVVKTRFFSENKLTVSGYVDARGEVDGIGMTRHQID